MMHWRANATVHLEKANQTISYSRAPLDLLCELLVTNKTLKIVLKQVARMAKLEWKDKRFIFVVPGAARGSRNRKWLELTHQSVLNTWWGRFDVRTFTLTVTIAHDWTHKLRLVSCEATIFANRDELSGAWRELIDDTHCWVGRRRVPHPWHP